MMELIEKTYLTHQITKLFLRGRCLRRPGYYVLNGFYCCKIALISTSNLRLNYQITKPKKQTESTKI